MISYEQPGLQEQENTPLLTEQYEVPEVLQSEHFVTVAGVVTGVVETIVLSHFIPW